MQGVCNTRIELVPILTALFYEQFIIFFLKKKIKEPTVISVFLNSDATAQRYSRSERKPKARPGRQNSNPSPRPYGGAEAQTNRRPPPRAPRDFSSRISFLVCPRRGAARPGRNRNGRVRLVGAWATGRRDACPRSQLYPIHPQLHLPSAICLPARPSGTTPPRTHTHSCTCPSAPLRSGAAVTSHRLDGVPSPSPLYILLRCPSPSLKPSRSLPSSHSISLLVFFLLFFLPAPFGTSHRSHPSSSSSQIDRRIRPHAPNQYSLRTTS